MRSKWNIFQVRAWMTNQIPSKKTDVLLLMPICKTSFHLRQSSMPQKCEIFAIASHTYISYSIFKATHLFLPFCHNIRPDIGLHMQSVCLWSKHCISLPRAINMCLEPVFSAYILTVDACFFGYCWQRVCGATCTFDTPSAYRGPFY